MINTAKLAKTLTDRKPLLKNAPRVLLAHTKDEKNKHEKFDFVLLLSHCNMCLDLFHIKRVLEAMTGELWPQHTSQTPF